MKAYQDGLINDYMANRISSSIDAGGLTDDISECLVNDAQYASDMGVENDDDYNVYFSGTMP